MGEAQIVFTRGWFIAAGENHGGTGGEGFVYRSRDAVHWTQVLEFSPPKGQHFEDLQNVLATPTGFVAWGTGIWTSDLDGEHWTQLPGTNLLSPADGAQSGHQNVTVDPQGGWLAPVNGAILRSFDGSHWRRDPRDLLPRGFSAEDMGHLPDGRIVAFGAVPVGDGLKSLDLVSGDGVTWSPWLHDDKLGFPIADTTGLVALGSQTAPDGCAITTLSRSADGGSTWHVESTLGLGRPGQLVRLPDGRFFATGLIQGPQGQGRPTAWVSADHGATWRSVIPNNPSFDFNGGAGGESGPVAVQVNAGRVVISIGFAYNKPVVDTLVKPITDL